MYLIIWKFQVKSGREQEFMRIYGPDGSWVKLFKLGEGYLGSQLLPDQTNPQRYLTIDNWVSPAAYETFRQCWQDEYQSLDRCFEELTEQEVKIGEFEVAKTELHN